MIVTLTVNELKAIIREVIVETKEVKPPVELPLDEGLLYSPEQVCKRFAISRVTLWQWGKKGIMNPVKIGHLVRYKGSEIERVLSQMRPQFSYKNAKNVKV